MKQETKDNWKQGLSIAEKLLEAADDDTQTRDIKRDINILVGAINGNAPYDYANLNIQMCNKYPTILSIADRHGIPRISEDALKSFTSFMQKQTLFSVQFCLREYLNNKDTLGALKTAATVGKMVLDVIPAEDIVEQKMKT